MPSSWKQQAVIDAPVQEVWSLIVNPSRFPEWTGDAIEVTGAPTTVEKGSTFTQRSHGPMGMKPVTTFEVVEFDDLHEIKLVCRASGYYSHWLLTEAQGRTFADLEFGTEPRGVRQRARASAITKRSLREMAQASLDGLGRILGGSGEPGGGGPEAPARP